MMFNPPEDNFIFAHASIVEVIFVSRRPTVCKKASASRQLLKVMSEIYLAKNAVIIDIDGSIWYTQLETHIVHQRV